MNQAEFTITGAGASQCDKILGALREVRGEWVAMPDLVTASDSFNVHSRIAELRKRGHIIEHKNERDERNTKRQHSFYRIIE